MKKKQIPINNFPGYILVFTLSLLLSAMAIAQTNEDSEEEKPATLGLDDGFITSETDDFLFKLVRNSQTMAALSPKLDTLFDFTPGERIENRNKDGYYHLGDVNLRLKKTSETEWQSYSSAAQRRKVESLPVSAPTLAAADLSNTFPEGMPLKIIRYWEKDGEALILRFHLQNNSEDDLEIGALGVPMIFNNILHRKSLDEAHAENVFYDPYIGMEAGYLQVVRLHGKGPVLLVLPVGKSGFEAYRPLNDDPTRRGITFEGFHEWMIHSKAYAENEWEAATPWNAPTSVVIAPGDSRDYAFKLVLAQDVKDIEPTLIRQNRPVAVGIPGYVLPMDVKATLIFKYGSEIRDFSVEPAGSISISPKASKNPAWKTLEVTGKKWGRSRLVIHYEDGLQQSINYKIIKSESQVMADFGQFLLTKQWYENEDDPFNRHQSVISYDYFEKQPVTQDSRAWLAGLSDEAGAGSWLAAIMKQLVQPDAKEIEQLNLFVNNTLWGGIQYSDGPLKYGVRKSMFYYEPEKMPEGTYSDSINYTTWAAWNQEQAASTVRSYNYPHVAAAHWVMYRLARYRKDLVRDHPWKWYLENAHHTAVAMVEQAPHYAQYGQMEGTIFLMILKDLRREGLDGMASELETVMRKRADVWSSLNYPFGSEMPWDSTGQEEVYMWTSFFGLEDMSEVTLNAILAYMPTVPHWGYNGSARRYWDFVFGGKLQRIERQLHHYGSAMNAIPVLEAYRSDPDDLYLLRVGYGGLMGAIANITEDGFGPAAFHSFPSTLEIDGYSGDYGTGFLGYAVNTSSFLYYDQDYGWLGFGGNVKSDEENVTMEITNAAGSRLFIAPLGLWLTLEAGKFESVSYNTNTKNIQIQLAPANAFTPNAYLNINQETQAGDVKIYLPESSFEKLNDTYVIPLKKRSVKINLK